MCKLLCSLLLLGLVSSSITINQINGISDNNLVYSGLLPVDEQGNEKLFFTFYGVDGVKDPSALADRGVAVFVGRYIFSYSVLAILAIIFL